MRMSCNGCRVLRKGCSNNCSIKPCLQWIKAPEAQSNATLFLAKFYGRAGLINLLNAGPHHLRPAIFKSLLYEACGRIVNPVSGSVGLAWSGSWRLCDAAVEAVLRGEPITQFAPSSDHLDLKACDIRHVSKDANNPAGDRGLHKVRSRPGSQFKRSAPKPKLPKEKPTATAAFEFLTGSGTISGSMILDSGVSLGPSHSPDHDHGLEGDTVSVETVEASLAKLDEPSDGSDVELDLTLGFK